MNRLKSATDPKYRKKVSKEVRKSNFEPPTRKKVSVSISPSDAKYKLRKPKIDKKAQEELKGMRKRMEIKLKKLHTKHSKRTTPGTTDEEREQPAAPQFVHVEGKRWIKTLAKQNVLKGKRLQKSLLKKKR